MDESDRIRNVGGAVFAGLGAAILALLLFGWLTEEVLRSDTVHFDAAVRTTVHSEASPWLTVLMKAISDVGAPIPVFLFTLAAGTILWLRNRRFRALLVLGTVLGSSALDEILKLSFHRLRPVPYFNIPVPRTYSFPSGHALVAFCFYGILAHLLTRGLKSRRQQAMIWFVAATMILLIGYSRIYLGVHYPTDVIGGYAAATVWLTTIIIAEQAISRRMTVKQVVQSEVLGTNA